MSNRLLRNSAIVAALAVVVTLATLPAWTSASDPEPPTGKLVVVPWTVQVGQTTLAVGFHVVPHETEVRIEYSKHFVPEGGLCDDASAGATPVSVAPQWTYLTACSKGTGEVRLVVSDTGNVIEEAAVPITPAGPTGQQSPSSIALSVSPNKITVGGETTVRVDLELDASREYVLTTVLLNSPNAAFDRGCSDFEETDNIQGTASVRYSYTAYGCATPRAGVWAYTTVGGRPWNSATLSDSIAISDVPPTPVPPTPVPPTNTDPEIEGPSSKSYPENGIGTVASYSASDDDAGDTVTLSLSGNDANDFNFSGGDLTFQSPPDYENPTDSDRNNIYSVTVEADDGRGGTDRLYVTTRVTNEEEPGTVALELSTTEPEVGTVITATLNDPDGGIRNQSWRWQRSSNGVSWSNISGATGSSYTPVSGDVGQRLRARVTYDDAHGTGKSATSAATSAVIPEPDIHGSVTLSTNSPQVGVSVTATLADGDGGIRNQSWRWQRSSNGVSWSNISGATGSSYTPVSGDVGQRLRARVTYDDAHGTGKSATSGATSNVTLPIPAVPNVHTNTAGDGTITLVWNRVRYADGYIVYQWNGVTWPALDPEDPNSPYPITFSESSSTISATISGLTNGTGYSHRVRSTNDSGMSGWTPNIHTDVPIQPPAAPIIYKTTDDGEITLYWLRPSYAETYEVEQWYGEGPNPEFRTLPFDQYDINGSKVPIRITDTKVTIGGLANGTSYRHRVRSKNKLYESAWSEHKITHLQLVTPELLDVTPLPLRRVRLKWNTFNNSPNTQYEVAIQAQGGSWTSTGTEKTGETSDFSDIKLDNVMSGKGLANAPYAYEIRVKATGSGSEFADTAYSDEITIIDSPIISVNGDSSLLQGPPAQDSTAGRAIVTWKRQQDATSYTLRWRKLGPDANGRAHSSDVWQLDRTSLPGGFDEDDEEEGISSSRTHFTIQPLDLREIYAVQLSYLTDDGWVFSARDAYVWPATSKPRSGERVAGYPFFGHFSSKTYEYRICEETFYPDDPTKQKKWVSLIWDALEQWERATNRFIRMTPEYKDSSEWEDSGVPEFKDCTTYPSWWQLILKPGLIPERIGDDAQRSEIRMLELPSGITDVGELTNIGEMLLDPFKLCVLGAPACTTSLVGYARLNRQASTVLPSADITFNGNKLASVDPKKPGLNGVQFNTCMEGTKPRPLDGSKGDTFYAYQLAVHESGHALGLSDWTLGGTAGSIAVSGFNSIVDIINLMDRVLFLSDLPDIPKLPEAAADLADDAIYRASHANTPGSVMNYDGSTGVNEPDCSPHPLDIMAIYALYQTGRR